MTTDTLELPELPERLAVMPKLILPEVHGMGGNTTVLKQIDAYTADQMRAYATAAVLAERERCAKLCDDYSKYLLKLAEGAGAHCETEAHAAEACSHLIVGRNEYGDEPDSEHFGDSFASAIRDKE